jgi:hypothetical protein
MESEMQPIYQVFRTVQLLLAWFDDERHAAVALWAWWDFRH